MLKLMNPFAGLEEIVTENEPLARYTWYRIGGPAKWLVRPRSLEEFQEAARRCSDSNPSGAVFRENTKTPTWA